MYRKSAIRTTDGTLPLFRFQEDLHGGVISVKSREGQTAVHQRRPGKQLRKLFLSTVETAGIFRRGKAILLLGIQALQSYMKRNGVSLRFSQHQCEEAPISVRRNRLPCGKSAVFHPSQAIIVSLPHQIFDPVEEGNLPSDFLPFFLRELRRIQFIAEGTGSRRV